VREGDKSKVQGIVYMCVSVCVTLLTFAAEMPSDAQDESRNVNVCVCVS